MHKALKDVLAGLAFVGFGVAFAIGATSYDIGTPIRMGPGFVPLALGVILAALGVLIIVKGYVAGEGDEIGEVPWRAIVLITVAIVIFGVTVRPLGLVPSLVAATVLAGLAPQRSGVVLPVAIAAGLTLASVLIFIVGLQLRLPLFGPLLRF
jgi:Tripartite tricarboxylate transporter TctB family